MPFATFLASQGVEILSTGGTAKAMRDAGLSVQDVSDYTGSKEILDGRVKTLHPMVHGGLLAVRGNSTHEQQMTENGIKPIDMVVMNLYAFDATVASGAAFDTCIENIDIGGPSMLRSSAKNHAYVTIATSPSQYVSIMEEMKANNGCTLLSTRRHLASAAFTMSATYDASISRYFATQLEDPAPVQIRTYKPKHALKYGCNPHQKPAGVFSVLGDKLPFQVLNGTPGYINYLDAMNAWQLVAELKRSLNMPAAASFKHCSPAGAALGVPLTPAEVLAYEMPNAAALTPAALAYVRARNADPMCSFGDFAALSDIVDVATAKVMKVEVCDGIIAPGFEPEALEILKSKKKGAFIVLQADTNFVPPDTEFREVYGACFSQKRNDALVTTDLMNNIVSGSSLPQEAKNDLILASIAIKYTQSNSVGYAKNGQMVGVGAGQQSRVDCVKLAGRKLEIWYLRQHPKVQGLKFKSTVGRQARVNARVRYIEGDITKSERPLWEANFEEVPSPLSAEEKTTFLTSLTGVSISSDAFFPFRDSIDHASKYGVQFVAQPGGSVADDEIKAACVEYGMTMAFTNLRLFHH